MRDTNDMKDGIFKTPAFVDTHIHGAFGCDTSDGNVAGMIRIAQSLPQKAGVAAFCPTTMTISEDDIFRAFEACLKASEELKNSDTEYAKILGMHLEGPFLSPKMAGVQDPSFLKLPCDGFKLIERLEREFPGFLKIIDIAPELEGAYDFIREFSDRYVISLAHTCADYDTACMAFEAGAKSVTHLLNAMPASGKRSPGVLGAAFDNNVWCELICDGIHISPSVLRMLFAMLDENKIIIVSDSMRGALMPDGEYYLGSVKVDVSCGRTYYGESRGLAGSVTYAAQELMRLVSFGVPKDKIIKALTVNPCERIGEDIESLNVGHNLFAEDFTLIKHV